MSSDVVVLVVDNRKINDWNEYNLCFSFINQNMHTVCNIYASLYSSSQIKMSDLDLETQGDFAQDRNRSAVCGIKPNVSWS